MSNGAAQTEIPLGLLFFESEAQGTVCLFYNNGSASVCIFINTDIDSIGWQHVFNKLGPFNEAECITAEVVLKSHIIDLFEFVDAIEVEMVDG